MNLEKVTVNFQRKKNLGNYESADASCMLTAFVEPGEDKAVVMGELWKMAHANVKAALAEYFTSYTAEELYLGLKIEEAPRKESNNGN